ncbi:MAG: hypothetical protein DMG30_23045 [Acidobacteria bacterium]|nr:MAG: hypothetical protein DMG30_23045 [Acidobacteriota bacterium]
MCLIAATVAFAGIHDLLFPQQRIVNLSGAVLPAVLLLVAVLAWFVIPVPLQKEPRLYELVS